MIFNKWLLSFIALYSFAVTAAPLKVVTTLPDLAEVARNLGGSEVEVQSLLKGGVDPHFADASPSFIQLVSRADLLISMGLELEVGWLPKVIERSNNNKVQAGATGNFEGGSSIQVLEKPEGTLDRSMGDVHADGNPHFNLSPRALSEMSEGLCNKLIELRPESKDQFIKNKVAFQQRMKKLEAEIMALIKPLKEDTSFSVIEYHKEFTYFLDLYEIKRFGSIEEKPGSPPSAGRLQEISERAKKRQVTLAMAATFSPEKHLKRFSELSGIPYIIVPAYVAEKSEPSTIEALQKLLAQRIVKESRKVK